MCRTRHDIDLPSYLGDYEFSVVPRSLFTPDGQLYKSTDKSVILNEIENLTNQAQDVLFHTSSVPNEKNSVIISDGMAIVNSISIESSKFIKTCQDFTNVFSNQIIDESQRFSEIRVIFDLYLDISLKVKRNDRTNSTQIQYKVDDSTIIKHLKTSGFFSHIKTKQDMTACLSQKLETASTKTNISYVISYKNKCLINVMDFDFGLQGHNREEADTLIILHCFQIAKIDLFREVVIVCCDTDLLLMLLYHYQTLCTQTIMRVGRGDHKRDINIEKSFEVIT